MHKSSPGDCRTSWRPQPPARQPETRLRSPVRVSAKPAPINSTPARSIGRMSAAPVDGMRGVATLDVKVELLLAVSGSEVVLVALAVLVSVEVESVDAATTTV